jgi:hypothetical protein
MLTPAAGSQQPRTAPLLERQHLVYAGAFRLPADVGPGHARFEGGGHSMSFDAANNTLWMSGLSRQWVAEVNIPAIRTGAALSDFSTATLRTPFHDVLNGTLDAIGKANNPFIGGTLPWLGDLIVSAYIYFDAGYAQTKSHFRVRGSTVTGPSVVGSVGAGYVGGWMTPIPAEWQGPLGGPALTGQCCIPIISRTSSGPAASVFNPADVGVKSPVPARQVLGYPLEHTTLGRPDSNGTLFNTTVYMGGMVFPAGTRSLLFIGGRKALGPFCYGGGQDNPALHGKPHPTPQSETVCYDPSNHDKGTHGYPYTHFIWAYDANDLVAVKNGKQSWQVVPYATWAFDLPFQHAQRVIAGVAWDPATKRLFLTATNGDGDLPLVHVFSIDTATAVLPTPPRSGPD